MDKIVQGVCIETICLRQNPENLTFKGWSEDILTNAEYFVFHFRMMLKHYRSVLFCAMNC